MQTAGKQARVGPSMDRHTYRNVLVGGAGTVDQLDDRVGVVDEVDGEGLVGEGIAVGCDEGLEVVGDGLCVGVAHAVGGGTLSAPAPGSGGCGCSEGNSCEGENRTHVGGDRWCCWWVARLGNEAERMSSSCSVGSTNDWKLWVVVGTRIWWE